MKPDGQQSTTNDAVRDGFKPLNGYQNVEGAYACAKLLEGVGIECCMRYRGRGLFGDVLTSEFTWVDVPEEDYERARKLLSPFTDRGCPQCGSKRIVFDVVSHKKGLGKFFVWPWDKERYSCDQCAHVWDTLPDDNESTGPFARRPE